MRIVCPPNTSAFGRVLLNKPEAVFLDEASSAMDEGLENAMADGKSSRYEAI
jgi:ABC-type uncharacterized transport system fused permease/ATPase subunit